MAVVAAGERFLAPIEPFLKSTSWRGVEIFVYSSAKKKKEKKPVRDHTILDRTRGGTKFPASFSSIWLRVECAPSFNKDLVIREKRERRKKASARLVKCIKEHEGAAISRSIGILQQRSFR